MRGVLDGDSIRRLVEGRPPLIEGSFDLERQLQPNGIDLTLRSVGAFTSGGLLGALPSGREVSSVREVPFDDEGHVMLSPGPYLITLNEIVNLPLDLAALGRPRSSLLRSGVALHTAVWDAGYSGRSQCLLVVHNPHGFRTARNARVVQLLFFQLTEQAPRGYGGIFQRENI